MIGLYVTKMMLRSKLSYYKDMYNFRKNRVILNYDNISYVNWCNGNPERFWLTRFIKKRFPEYKGDIRFYGVLGPRDEKLLAFDGIKLFFSGENLEQRVLHDGVIENKYKTKFWDYRIKLYNDYLIDDVDISMGFADKNEKNYFRFPLWIMYLFDPAGDRSDINNRLDQINSNKYNASRKGAAIVASHDFFGSRTAVYNGLNGVIPIEFGGKWNNNSDRLIKEFNNDKIRYLNNFRFNICPENMDAPLYVTEKIFDAFKAGCIPIYSGALGNPEPGIINPDAFILWDYDGSNEESISKIDLLEKDDAFYEQFCGIPKLLPETADYVEQIINELENRIRALI